MRDWNFEDKQADYYIARYKISELENKNKRLKSLLQEIYDWINIENKGVSKEDVEIAFKIKEELNGKKD